MTSDWFMHGLLNQLETLGNVDIYVKLVLYTSVKIVLNQ